MKVPALAITLLGIFVLIILLNLSSPTIINNSSELSKLTDNTKVQTTGKALSERILYEDTKLLKLDNDIEILCKSCPSYVNRTFRVLGTVERYLNKSQINALTITLP